ncbi:MAG: hypothetical protein NC548_46515 [Lachnospiraceae bacterium]|nr:hypothetical protein [Prevotella sp.]MCM1074633.1 hypothetical protein [Ruminococcus sp.]MCM1221951.1 hypothetical protein [Lachnospiraceae bacterium]
MKKFLLTAAAGIAALSANAADIKDYCGDYQWRYHSVWDAPASVKFQILEGKKPGKVLLDGLYKSYDGGWVTVEADIDLEAGTISIPFTDLIFYEADLQCFKVLWGEVTEDDYTEILPVELSNEPLVGTLGENGVINFKPMEGLAFGTYSDDISTCSLYEAGREMSFVPYEDTSFEYDESEWEVVGTAIYPDMYFGYYIFGDRIPYEATVNVAVNKKDNKQVLLVNPYDNEHWRSVNKDKEAKGFIKMDLTDPDCVIFEPYVYSGFDFDYQRGDENRLTLGKTYCYNEEGYYTRIEGLSVEETKEFLAKNQVPSTYYDDGVIFLTSNGVLFSTETKPKIKYDFGGSLYGELRFDENAQKAIEASQDAAIEGVQTDVNAPAEYYTVEGVKVSGPVKGGVTICRKGNKVTKIIR